MSDNEVVIFKTPEELQPQLATAATVESQNGTVVINFAYHTASNMQGIAKSLTFFSRIAMSENFFAKFARGCFDTAKAMGVIEK